MSNRITADDIQAIAPGKYTREQAEAAAGVIAEAAAMKGAVNRPAPSPTTGGTL